MTYDNIVSSRQLEKSTIFGGVFYASQKRGFMLYSIRSLVCNYCDTLYITEYHLYIIEYHGRQIQSVRIYYVDLYPIDKKFPDILWYFIIFMDALNSVGIPAVGRIVALFRLVGIPNPFMELSPEPVNWFYETINSPRTPPLDGDSLVCPYIVVRGHQWRFSFSLCPRWSRVPCLLPYGVVCC